MYLAHTRMNNLPDVPEVFAQWVTDPAVQPFAWLLMKRLQEGHVCVDPTELPTALPTNLEEQFPKLPALPESSEYIGQAGDLKPFILHEGRLYLQRYFQYETQILAAVQRLLAHSAAEQAARKDALLKQVAFIQTLSSPAPPTATPAEQYDWQLVAALMAAVHSLMFITGGPGTGKTTTVAKLLAILYQQEPNLRVALAAPTGKAAMRMAESLKHTQLPLTDETRAKFQQLNPSTIHRLLGSKRNSLYFKHDAAHPLPVDVLIVDEASMIDMPLFAKLLDAVPPNGRVILLGDRHQLASVEAGSLLGDFCESLPITNALAAEDIPWLNQFIPYPDSQIPTAYAGVSAHPLVGHIVELQLSRRFQSGGGIGKLSTAVIRNQQEVIDSFLTTTVDNSVQLDTQYDSATLDRWVAGYASIIAEPDIGTALRLLQKFRVLVAVREGPQGLHAINQRIEQRLVSRGLIRRTIGFYEHQPIMITRNNSDLELYNGDTGLLRCDAEGRLRAWFEDSSGQIRSIIPGYLQAVETVYAMTIHKSQGSEYDEVLVILPDQENAPLLTRELLYTAITRARQHVTIQARLPILLQTMAAQVKRSSGLPQRLSNLIP